MPVSKSTDIRETRTLCALRRRLTPICPPVRVLASFSFSSSTGPRWWSRRLPIRPKGRSDSRSSAVSFANKSNSARWTWKRSSTRLFTFSNDTYVEAGGKQKIWGGWSLPLPAFARARKKKRETRERFAFDDQTIALESTESAISLV